MIADVSRVLTTVWIILCGHQVFRTTDASTFVSDKSLTPVGQRRCVKPVPILIPECQNTFYNFTGMPNLVEQETQFDARHQLQTFKPLITYKCSSKLNFFLCSVYTPMCDANTRYLIGPCRPLCEHVRARCAPVLRVFDFDWPANLNCSRFPVKNSVDGAMCMEGPPDAEEESIPITSQTVEPDLVAHPVDILTSANGDNGEENNSGELNLSHANFEVHAKDGETDPVNQWILKFAKLQLAKEQEAQVSQTKSVKLGAPSSISLLAQSLRHCSYLKKPTYYVYVNRTGRCAPLCRSDILFTPDAKSLVFVWTSILSAICSVITTFTLVGYALDTSVFRASERPVIYIALCQLIYSLGYALSLGLGRETVTCGLDLDSGREIRLQEGLDNSVCALVFMTQYFFFIASSIWWTLTAIHWALEHSPCWMTSLCWDPGEFSSIRGRSSAGPGSLCDIWGEAGGEPKSLCIGSRVASTHPTTDQELGWLKDFTLSSVGGNGPTKGRTETEAAGSAPPIPGNLSQLRPIETALYCLQNGKVVPTHQVFGWTASHPSVLASRRYSNRANEDRFATCLAREHVIVWLTSGLLTVGVLVSRQVDSDELVPVCGVGRQHTKAMGAFVVGPELVLTLTGMITLAVGAILTFIRRRRVLNRDRARYHSIRATEMPTSDSSRLIRSSPIGHGNGFSTKPRNDRTHFGGSVQEPGGHQSSMPTESFYDQMRLAYTNPLMNNNSFASNGWLRMGLFCFLYLLPVACVTACDIYEYLSRDKWLRDSSYKNPEPDQGQPFPSIPFPPKLWKPEEVVGPSPELFMLRIFMSLVTGFTSALWIWSVKGCEPWNRICRPQRWCTSPFPLSRLRGKKSNASYSDPTSSSWCRSATVNQPEKSTFAHDRPFTHGFHGRPPGPGMPMVYTSHPYAVYQYNSSKTGTCHSNIQENPKEEATSRLPATGGPSAWNPSVPVLIDPGAQIMSAAQGPETQHSNATTPGYYSQAKVGSTIEPNMSDTFSEESPIPPPLPASSRPQLPARGDPCIGATTTHLSTLAMAQPAPNTLNAL
ncbi:Frizzled-4 [Fasciola gigantica]|uniref:Frizzled-4 n=1 Tax=Fasciola gigantica TaxID=46835 RepID=A0A504Z0D7_FASGI|nr:Frizzled-4 [Fasciola gigantica]